MLKICGWENCEEEFDAKGGTKYCSVECKISARRKADADNHKKHYHQDSQTKAKRVQYAKDWKKRNKDKSKTIYASRNRRRRATDIRHVINNRIGPTIARALKGKKAGKRWEELVGYTANELIKHLNSTMPKGATWENFLRGELHIDHIVPRCRFKFNSYKDPEFKVCWSINNLQLLWARDNLSKGSS